MPARAAEVIVIGAGIVGLAIARAIACRDRTVLIVEREPRIGLGISARGSGVIHAGVYYTFGSLKSRLCIAGRTLLYQYCAAHGVAHQRCGKLIVACGPGELAQLATLHNRARRVLGSELTLLDAAAMRRIEPELAGVAAIFSPQTGIVDVPGLLAALYADARDHGASLLIGTEVTAISVETHSAYVTLAPDGRSLHASQVVNASGLSAPRLAATVGVAPGARLAKGTYFALRGIAPFSRLIYPLPPPGGLGIHLTFDLTGHARFGPDVESIDEPDYVVDPSRAPIFYEAIRRYWPGLEDGALEPAYAGVRPRLGPVQEDFRIERRGRLINLFGIESPGLTAALAIGAYVANLTEADR